MSENVQDVPLTVNVLTAEALTDRGIVNLSQINGVASNVVWEDLCSTTRNRITIRGIASNDNSASFDPGIGVYVDDVYLASGLMRTTTAAACSCYSIHPNRCRSSRA